MFPVFQDVWNEITHLEWNPLVLASLAESMSQEKDIVHPYTKGQERQHLYAHENKKVCYVKYAVGTVTSQGRFTQNTFLMQKMLECHIFRIMRETLQKLRAQWLKMFIKRVYIEKKKWKNSKVERKNVFCVNSPLVCSCSCDVPVW